MVKPSLGQVERLRQGMMIAVLVMAMATPAAAQAVDPALATPCLQKLQEEQIKNPPKPKKANAGRILGTIFGAGLGYVAGSVVCQRGDTSCRVGMAAAGGAGGFLLGKSIDKKQERKFAETSYAAALTGKPAGLTFEKSCALVEPLSPTKLERRQVQFAMASDIAPPATLRTIAEFNAPAAKSPIPMAARPAPAGNAAVARLQPGKPMFVMGAVDNGRYLLIADGSFDVGYTARGYVPAAGWTRVASPENQQPVLGQPRAGAQDVTMEADVPCWTQRQVFREESGKRAKQESRDIKICRYPDGTSAPDTTETAGS